MPAPIFSLQRRLHCSVWDVDLPYRGDELISATGNGLNEEPAVLTVTQDSPYYKNVLAEIALFHEAFWPEGLHKFIFFQCSSPVLKHKKKSIKRFWSQSHRFTVTH